MESCTGAERRPPLLRVSRSIKQARHAGPIIAMYYRTLMRIKWLRLSREAADYERISEQALDVGCRVRGLKSARRSAAGDARAGGAQARAHGRGPGLTQRTLVCSRS